jgi:predicted short-subunit dehydrogenase-like oxidoreductase (DUF2520 family)
MSGSSDRRNRDATRRVVIIGPGRVGSYWARAALRGGVEVDLRARKPDEAPADLRQYAAPITADLPRNSWAGFDAVVLTCSDDSIATLCQQIVTPAALHDPASGPIIAHVSGRFSTEILTEAGVPAARAASAHPLYPFTSTDSSPEPEQVFHAIDGVPSAAEGMAAILRDIGAPSFFLHGADRALYHLACVMASNHLVTLDHVAQTLMERATGGGNVPPEALRNLMEASLQNLRGGDGTRALSGPAQRGDAAAISQHIHALQRLAPEHEALYAELLRATLPILPKSSKRIMADLLNSVSLLSRPTSDKV